MVPPEGSKRSVLYTIAVEGGFPELLVSSQANLAIPFWSGDGETVFYQSDEGANFWQLWSAARTGDRPRQLTDTPSPQIAAANVLGPFVLLVRGRSLSTH